MRQFYGRLEKMRSFCRKNHVRKIPLFWGGVLGGGGGRADFIFMGARIFLNRVQRINANIFCTKFFDNPSGHGRPRRKSWTSAPKTAFSCGPGGREKLLTPGHPGVRVRNVRGKSGEKSLCLCFLSSLMLTLLTLQSSSPVLELCNSKPVGCN